MRIEGLPKWQLVRLHKRSLPKYWWAFLFPGCTLFLCAPVAIPARQAQGMPDFIPCPYSENPFSRTWSLARYKWLPPDMPSGKRFAMFPERFLRRVVRVVTLLTFLALLLLGESVSEADASGHVAGARLPSASAIGAGYFLVIGRQAQLFHFIFALLLFVTATGLLLCLRRMRELSRQRISRAENRAQEILELFSCLQSEYDAILDTVSDFVMFLTPEQKITWVNRNAESALGTEYATITGRSCHEIWHTLIGDGYLCPGRKCFISGVPERSIGWTRDKKQFDIRAIPVRDSCGNIVRIIEIGRDITAQSRLEQQLRQLQKVDSLGWLATGISP